MNLTKHEEILLEKLLDDPVWISLLEHIKTDSEVKPWKPGGEKDEEAKRSQWIFDSGIKRGVSNLLDIFSLQHTQRK